MTSVCVVIKLQEQSIGLGVVILTYLCDTGERYWHVYLVQCEKLDVCIWESLKQTPMISLFA